MFRLSDVALWLDLWHRFRASSTAIAILAILLAIDLFFIGVQTLTMASQYSPKVNFDGGFLSFPIFDITKDWTIPEIMGYAKLAIVAYLLFLCFRKQRQPIYAILAGIFFLLLLDDSVQLHELVGRAATSLEAPSVEGLRPQDTGEIVMYVGWLVLFALLLAYAVRHSRRDDCMTVVPLVILIGALAMCGVIFDMLGPLLVEWISIRIGRMFALAEDGGEMIVMTLLLVTAMVIYREVADGRLGAGEGS